MKRDANFAFLSSSLSKKRKNPLEPLVKDSRLEQIINTTDLDPMDFDNNYESYLEEVNLKLNEIDEFISESGYNPNEVLCSYNGEIILDTIEHIVNELKATSLNQCLDLYLRNNHQIVLTNSSSDIAEFITSDPKKIKEYKEYVKRGQEYFLKLDDDTYPYYGSEGDLVSSISPVAFTSERGKAMKFKNSDTAHLAKMNLEIKLSDSDGVHPKIKVVKFKVKEPKFLNDALFVNDVTKGEVQEYFRKNYGITKMQSGSQEAKKEFEEYAKKNFNFGKKSDQIIRNWENDLFKLYEDFKKKKMKWKEFVEKAEKYKKVFTTNYGINKNNEEEKKGKRIERVVFDPTNKKHWVDLSSIELNVNKYGEYYITYHGKDISLKELFEFKYNKIVEMYESDLAKFDYNKENGTFGSNYDEEQVNEIIIKCKQRLADLIKSIKTNFGVDIVSGKKVIEEDFKEAEKSSIVNAFEHNKNIIQVLFAVSPNKTEHDLVMKFVEEVCPYMANNGTLHDFINKLANYSKRNEILTAIKNKVAEFNSKESTSKS